MACLFQLHIFLCCYSYGPDEGVMAESAKRDDAGTPPPCRRACIDNSLISVQSSDGDVGDDSCIDSELDGE